MKNSLDELNSSIATAQQNGELKAQSLPLVFESFKSLTKLANGGDSASQILTKSGGLEHYSLGQRLAEYLKKYHPEFLENAVSSNQIIGTQSTSIQRVVESEGNFSEGMVSIDLSLQNIIQKNITGENNTTDSFPSCLMQFTFTSNASTFESGACGTYLQENYPAYVGYINEVPNTYNALKSEANATAAYKALLNSVFSSTYVDTLSDSKIDTDGSILTTIVQYMPTYSAESDTAIDVSEVISQSQSYVLKDCVY